MAEITVPKTPKRAYNPDRPPSGLIRAQIEYLEAAVAGDAQPKTMTRRVPPRTEGEAAEYIAELTARLHPLPGAVPAPPGSSAVEAPTDPVNAGPTRGRRSETRGGSVKPRIKAAATRATPKRAGATPARKVASRKRGRRA